MLLGSLLRPWNLRSLASTRGQPALAGEKTRRVGSAEPRLWVPPGNTLLLCRCLADKGLPWVPSPQAACQVWAGVSSKPHVAVQKGQACCPLDKSSFFLSTTCFPSRSVSGKRCSWCVGSAGVEPWAHCYPIPPHAILSAWPGCPQPLWGFRSSLLVPPNLLPCCWVGSWQAALGHAAPAGVSSPAWLTSPHCPLSPSSGPEHV